MSKSRARKFAELLDSSGNIKGDRTNAAKTLSDLNVTASHSELNKLDGLTATTAELNTMDGVTASASELNTLDGVTATTAELNLLDGVTATTAELNYTDGVTSNIQTQIDNIASDLVDDASPQLGADLDTNGNDIDFGDNDVAHFGTGNDLHIYHDGSNSFIKDVGTGRLKVGAQDFQLGNADLTETMMFAVPDGSVSLYHNNVKKFETTADGIEALRPASNGIIQSWRRGTTEVAKLTVESTDNVTLSAMQGDGAGLHFWGSGGTAYINPVKEGSQINGNVQLGRSQNRFKNLYLSGEGGGNAAVDVRQGVVKHWVNYNENGGVRDSYNNSSVTDRGTGNWRIVINNNFNNNDWSATGTAGTDTDSNGYRMMNLTVKETLTGSCGIETVSPSNNSDYDCPYNGVSIHGDLA